MSTNEAAMTGEADELSKVTLDVCLERIAENGAVDYKNVDKMDSHLIPSCLLLSGTSVETGEGKMIAIVVGENSAVGVILKKLEVRPEATPL